MNFIKSSSKEIVKSVNLLSSKAALITEQPQCGMGILKKPKKIKGVIEPTPHLKIDLIDGVNQPEFLKYLKPTVPFYGVHNIQLKGYDHVMLDEFRRFVFRILAKLDIKVKDKWNTPSEEFSVETLQNESYGVEDSIKINVYERTIQIDELPSYKAPILLEMLTLSKPPGIKIAVEKHDPSVLKKLYMIDVELEKAKLDLKEWSKPVEELARTKKGSY